MIVCSLFIQPLKALHDFTNKLPQFVDSMYPHIEPYAWPAASISQTWTIWILLLVTVDRYIAVCLPLSRHLRSVRKTKLATSATLVLAVLYNVPLFLEREVKHPHSACSAFPASIGRTTLGDNFVYFVVYKTLCFFAFRSGGPLVILIYLNTRLYRALRMRRRRLTSRARIQHNNVTMTLVAVVSVFIVCELPDAILRLTVAVRKLITGQYNDLEVNVDASIPGGTFCTTFVPSDKLFAGQGRISTWMRSYCEPTV